MRSTRPRATPAAGCVPPGYRPGRAAGRTRAGLGLPVRVGPARHSVRPSEYDSPRRRSMGSRGPRPARIDCPCPGLERRLPTLGMGTERPVACSPGRWLKFGPVHLAGPAGLGRAVGRPVRIRVHPRAAVRIRPVCHDLCLSPCPPGLGPGVGPGRRRRMRLAACSHRQCPWRTGRQYRVSSPKAHRQSVPRLRHPSVPSHHPSQFLPGTRAISSPAAPSVSSPRAIRVSPPGPQAVSTPRPKAENPSREPSSRFRERPSRPTEPRASRIERDPMRCEFGPAAGPFRARPAAGQPLPGPRAYRPPRPAAKPEEGRAEPAPNGFPRLRPGRTLGRTFGVVPPYPIPTQARALRHWGLRCTGPRVGLGAGGRGLAIRKIYYSPTACCRQVAILAPLRRGSQARQRGLRPWDIMVPSRDPRSRRGSLRFASSAKCRAGAASLPFQRTR